jgi:hypothetical protein
LESGIRYGNPISTGQNHAQLKVRGGGEDLGGVLQP